MKTYKCYVSHDEFTITVEDDLTYDEIYNIACDYICDNIGAVIPELEDEEE